MSLIFSLLSEATWKRKPAKTYQVVGQVGRGTLSASLCHSLPPRDDVLCLIVTVFVFCDAHVAFLTLVIETHW